MRRDDALRDRFDLFPKISDDFARRTATGGAIATIGLALMVILFLQQTAELMRTTTAYDLRVDDGVAGATKKIVINVDLTLRAMHCAQVSLDAMDVTGETRLDVSRSEVRTKRVDARGRAIAMTSERTAVNAKTEAGERESGSSPGVRRLLARFRGEHCWHFCCARCLLHRVTRMQQSPTRHLPWGTAMNARGRSRVHACMCGRCRTIACV